MIANSLSLQKSVFKQTKEHFGSLDIVVNNAGIFDEKNWGKMIKVNLVKFGTNNNFYLLLTIACCH